MLEGLHLESWTVMAYFKVLPQHLPGRSEESHESFNPHSRTRFLPNNTRQV